MRNFERWPILGEYVNPNYFVGDSYESEVDWMNNWETERVENLDNILPGICENVTNIPLVEFGNSKIYPSLFSTKITVQIQSGNYKSGILLDSKLFDNSLPIGFYQSKF